MEEQPTRSERLFSPTLLAGVLAGHLIPEGTSPPRLALDLGCGRGVLARHMIERGAHHVVATDIDPRIVEAGARDFLGCTRAPRFVCGDLFEPAGGPFDLIAFNPPFFPSRAVGRGPQGIRPAFDGGPTGREMVCRALDQAAAHLASQGRFVWLMPADWAQWMTERSLAAGLRVHVLERRSVSCATSR